MTDDHGAVAQAQDLLAHMARNADLRDRQGRWLATWAIATIGVLDQMPDPYRAREAGRVLDQIYKRESCQDAVDRKAGLVRKLVNEEPEDIDALRRFMDARELRRSQLESLVNGWKSPYSSNPGEVRAEVVLLLAEHAISDGGGPRYQRSRERNQAAAALADGGMKRRDIGEVLLSRDGSKMKKSTMDDAIRAGRSQKK